MALWTGKDGKSCTRCGEWKKYSEFSKDKTKTDGYCSRCKDCKRQHKELWDNNQRKAREMQKSTVLVIPDLQAPYHHPDALAFLKDVRNHYNPAQIVSIGDELDKYALSDFETDPEELDPRGEFLKAYDFWQEMFQHFPEGIGVKSNHVHGRMEKARKRGKMLRAYMRSFEEIINAPKGWGWVDQVEIDNVIYVHGHKHKKNAKLEAEYYSRELGRPVSVLMGHHHTEIGSKGDEFWGGRLIWGGFSGALIDFKRRPFDYTIRFPRLGCVVVIEGRLHPVLMGLDKDYRWTGELIRG